MSEAAQPQSLGGISEFVKTHCMTCAAGWTRLQKDGPPVVVCLLDREPVWPQMIECSRFERLSEVPPSR